MLKGNNNFNRWLAVFCVLCVLAFSTLRVQAVALPYPILPYVPPLDDQLFDVIANSSGVQALKDKIAGASNRAQAWWNLYRGAVSLTWDSFELQLKDAFDNARSTGTLTLSSDLMTGIQEALYAAVDEGLPVNGEPESITEKEELLSKIREYASDFSDIYMGYCSQTLNDLYRNYPGVTFTACIVKRNPANFSRPSCVYFYSIDDLPVTVSLTSDSCMYFNSSGNIVQAYGYVIGGYGYNNSAYPFPISLSSSDGLYAGGFTDTVNFGAYSVSRLKLGTHSPAVTDALRDGTNHIITGDSVIENGELDVTKPVIIVLPVTLPVTSDIDDIPSVQDDIGAVPTSMTDDITQTRTDIREAVQARYGNINDYKLNLTSFFPFCIPFDIGNLISAFDAEPEAPHFTFTFPMGYDPKKIYIKYADGHSEAFLPKDVPASLPSGAKNTGHVLCIDKEISLEAFDGVAYWLRMGEKAIFIVGLAVATRQIYLRG